jgi:hypothetical protein
MSNENIVYSNELVVRFEQDAEGVVNWIVKPDAAVDSTSHATLDELARAGAPLAALATRALWELLYQNMINLALERGNMYLWKECYRELSQEVPSGSGDIEGEVVGATEGAVVVN